MTISATVTSKGQVSIPKPIRALLNLAQNDLIMSLYGSLKTDKKYVPLSKIRKKLQKELGH